MSDNESGGSGYESFASGSSDSESSGKSSESNKSNLGITGANDDIYHPPTDSEASPLANRRQQRSFEPTLGLDLDADDLDDIAFQSAEKPQCAAAKSLAAARLAYGVRAANCRRPKRPTQRIVIPYRTAFDDLVPKDPPAKGSSAAPQQRHPSPPSRHTSLRGQLAAWLQCKPAPSAVTAAPVPKAKPLSLKRSKPVHPPPFDPSAGDIAITSPLGGALASAASSRRRKEQRQRKERQRNGAAATTTATFGQEERISASPEKKEKSSASSPSRKSLSRPATAPSPTAKGAPAPAPAPWRPAGAPLRNASSERVDMSSSRRSAQSGTQEQAGTAGPLDGEGDANAVERPATAPAAAVPPTAPPRSSTIHVALADKNGANECSRCVTLRHRSSYLRGELEKKTSALVAAERANFQLRVDMKDSELKIESLNASLADLSAQLFVHGDFRHALELASLAKNDADARAAAAAAENHALQRDNQRLHREIRTLQVALDALAPGRIGLVPSLAPSNAPAVVSIAPAAVPNPKSTLSQPAIMTAPSSAASSTRAVPAAVPISMEPTPTIPPQVQNMSQVDAVSVFGLPLDVPSVPVPQEPRSVSSVSLPVDRMPSEQLSVAPSPTADVPSAPVDALVAAPTETPAPPVPAAAPVALVTAPAGGPCAACGGSGSVLKKSALSGKTSAEPCGACGGKGATGAVAPPVPAPAPGPAGGPCAACGGSGSVLKKSALSGKTSAEPCGACGGKGATGAVAPPVPAAAQAAVIPTSGPTVATAALPITADAAVILSPQSEKYDDDYDSDDSDVNLDALLGNQPLVLAAAQPPAPADIPDWLM